jgi:uncharacterized damage-inducible protein DinB
MNAALGPLALQFNLHTKLFRNATEGIDDKEASFRNNEHANHIKWIAGHLLNTRLNFFNNVTGHTPDSSLAPLFGQGKSLDMSVAYPSFEELTKRWEEVSAQVGARMLHIPENVLTAPAPFQTGTGDDTMLGLIAFLTSHEAYHIGQLGILRKMAGKPAMSYK